MPNITLAVDESVIKKVRKIAVERNTTLTQMVREFLESVAKQDTIEKEQALKRLKKSLDKFSRDMGERQWTRESLYER